MILELINGIPCVISNKKREITMTMDETRLNGGRIISVYCLGWHDPEDFLEVFRDEYRGEIFDIDSYSVEDVQLSKMDGYCVTRIKL